MMVDLTTFLHNAIRAGVISMELQVIMPQTQNTISDYEDAWRVTIEFEPTPIMKPPKKGKR